MAEAEGVQRAQQFSEKTLFLNYPDKMLNANSLVRQ